MYVAEKGALNMQRKLLTNGNIFKRTDGRWNGVVWYSDEQGAKKRKSFCGTTKQEVKEKITDYLADFDRQLTASDESKARLEENMRRWLRIFKFPSVERGTYDRLECTATHQIYPVLGGKVVGDITSADIKALLNRSVKALAQQYGADYVSIPYTSIANDGHPTVCGHKYIARQILKAVRK